MLTTDRRRLLHQSQNSVFLNTFFYQHSDIKRIKIPIVETNAQYWPIPSLIVNSSVNLGAQKSIMPCSELTTLQ